MAYFLSTSLMTRSRSCLVQKTFFGRSDEGNLAQKNKVFYEKTESNAMCRCNPVGAVHLVSRRPGSGAAGRGSNLYRR